MELKISFGEYKKKINEIMNCDNHCHISIEGIDSCVPLIEDCDEHYHKCGDGCHEECTCQNP